nr:DUF6049 family protein [Tessaracoccus sp. OS52]
MGWQATAVAAEPTRSLPLAVDLGANATLENTRSLGRFGVGTVFVSNVEDGTRSGAVVAATPLEQTGLGPGGRDTTAQHLGRRLAEEFLAATPPVYVLRSAADVRALGSLEHNTVVPVPQSGEPLQLAQPWQTPEPWAQLAAGLEEVHSRSEFLEDLTGVAASQQVTDLLSAKASSAGFADEAAAIAYVDAHPVAAVDTNQVTISAAGQFVMGSRTNDFPVTIVNGLSFPVTVRLVFESAAPQRIKVPPTDFVTVEPGQNLTLNVAPEASSNGVVAVDAALQTRGGETFGIPVTIEITATDLGRVGWIIIIVSGAVVLGGTVLRIRAVQRENAKGVR